MAAEEGEGIRPRRLTAPARTLRLPPPPCILPARMKRVRARAMVLGCVLGAIYAPVFAQEEPAPPPSEPPGREVSLPQSEVKDTFFAYVLGIITAGLDMDVNNAQMRDILTEFKSTLAVPFDLIDRVRQHTDAETGACVIEVEFTRDVVIPVPFALLFYHPGTIQADQDLVWQVHRAVFYPGTGEGPVEVFDLVLWRGSVQVNIDDWLEALFSASLEDTWIHHIVFFRWKGNWIGLLEGAGRRTGRVLRAYFDFTKNAILFPPAADLEKAGRALVDEPAPRVER
jgi:hypothetical protein